MRAPAGFGLLLVWLASQAAFVLVSAEHVRDEDIQDVLPRDAIPAITDPRFDDGAWLRPEDRVIGVDLEGEARAYPHRILVWHEVADDRIGSTAFAVTYCPLCGTGIVFDRVVGGEELLFKVSGKLYKSDLVMYDTATDSLWSQVAGEAIQGAHHGARLAVLPAVTTTWDAWMREYPESVALSRDTGHSRDYDRDPYAGYGDERRIGISGEQRGNVYAMHPKEFVLGYEDGTEALAFRFQRLAQEGVAHATVAGRDLVATWDGGGAHLFEAAGHRFHRDGEVLRDATGSAWNPAKGESDDGERLMRVDALESFWFAWYDFHPTTRVWGALGLVAAEPSPGSEGVNASEPLRLIFTEEIRPEDRDHVSAWLRIAPDVAWEATWETPRILVVRPLPEWGPTRVEATIGAALQDIHGNTVGGDLRVGFSTLGEPAQAPFLGAGALLAVLLGVLLWRRQGP